MSGAAVETVLYFLDEAFDKGEHSLLVNIRSLPEGIWFALPSGSSRSAYDMVWHVAACKWMYNHYAFGEAVWTWPEMESTPYEGGPPCRPSEREAQDVPALLYWLQQAHERLRAHVAALDDEDLLALRRANWGKSYETRWLVKVMVEHDLYHAGEINHLRSLIQGQDRWAHEM